MSTTRRKIMSAKFSRSQEAALLAIHETPVTPIGAPQALSGAGAITITEYATNFTSTGAGDALTLADGTNVGQLKKVTHVVDGGSGVITPTSLAGGTTVTLTAAGDAVTFAWNGTNWVAQALVGTAALA